LPNGPGPVCRVLAYEHLKFYWKSEYVQDWTFFDGPSPHTSLCGYGLWQITQGGFQHYLSIFTVDNYCSSITYHWGPMLSHLQTYLSVDYPVISKVCPQENWVL
jgi:hypothetical protein